MSFSSLASEYLLSTVFCSRNELLSLNGLQQKGTDMLYKRKHDKKRMDRILKLPVASGDTVGKDG